MPKGRGEVFYQNLLGAERDAREYFAEKKRRQREGNEASRIRERLSELKESGIFEGTTFRALNGKDYVVDEFIFERRKVRLFEADTVKVRGDGKRKGIEKEVSIFVHGFFPCDIQHDAAVPTK